MILKYIHWSIRYARRKLLLTTINIVGLTIGTACTLAIFLYVYGEWSHDRHFDNAERIYRIGIGFFNTGPYANGPEILNETLSSEFEGVEAFTSFQTNNREVVDVDNHVYTLDVYYVDSSFFDVFSYHFVKGDPSKAMTENSSMVITEEMARKFFGDQEPMGRLIAVGKGKIPFQVKGVVADSPDKSHLKAGIWISKTKKRDNGWMSASFYNYTLLKANVQRKDLENALDRIIEKDIYPLFGSREQSLADYKRSPEAIKFVVQPLTDIYLHSKLALEISPGGNPTNLFALSLIDVFIIALVVVNFVNLSISQSVQRAKEIGIKKALGSSRSHLVAQFTTDSILISFLAFALAIALLKFVVTSRLGVTSEQIPISLLEGPLRILGLFSFAAILGVVAGVYPAFYLTSFSAHRALKGGLRQGGGGTKLFLVGFQFSVSICLIICTLVVNGQLRYMSEKDLGFDPENVLVIDNLYHLDANSAARLKDRISRSKDVSIASLHHGEPGGKYSYLFESVKTPAMKDLMNMTAYYGDDNFIKLMGFRLVAGRNFIRGVSSDSSAVILNEAAARALDIHRDPIGQVLNGSTHVIGVVEDFHSESLRSQISAVVIRLPNPKTSTPVYDELSVRMRRGVDLQSSIAYLEREWKQITPEAFEYHRLSDNFNAMLAKERSLEQIISFFTCLAVFISCLGLFGLSTLLINSKTREIGIRKVMGASTTTIVFLVNKEFLKPVIFAMAIGAAGAFYFMHNWLTSFAYHEGLRIQDFVLAGLIAIAVGTVTVSYHSIKASVANPVKALREE